MSYVDRTLAPGERMVYRTKLHPVVFVFLPSVVALASVGAFLTNLVISASVLLAIAAAAAFVGLRIYRRSDFAVTNRRIFGTMGSGANPEYDEIALIELQAAEYKPGLLSALADYGTVTITDRQGRVHKFSAVSKELYEHVQARDERVRRILR